MSLFRVTSGLPGAPARGDDQLEKGGFRSEIRARIFALDRSLFGAPRLYWVWKRADDGRDSWSCIATYQGGRTYTPPTDGGAA